MKSMLGLRANVAAGKYQSQIARDMGVTPTTVARWASRMGLEIKKDGCQKWWLRMSDVDRSAFYWDRPGYREKVCAGLRAAKAESRARRGLAAQLVAP
jgi:hypothetical protein